MSNDLAVELANRLKLPVDVVDGLLKIKMKNKFNKFTQAPACLD
jgi:hypothetical protein